MIIHTFNTYNCSCIYIILNSHIQLFIMKLFIYQWNCIIYVLILYFNLLWKNIEIN